MNADILYMVTSIVFLIPWLILWYIGSLSIVKMIILLFIFDMALTVEAGLESNVLLIAVLHVVTIPAFFGLIYLDIVEQHRTEFNCFVCGKYVKQADEVEEVKRMVNGRRKNVLVHSTCVKLENRDWKSFSRRIFGKGIPE